MSQATSLVGWSGTARFQNELLVCSDSGRQCGQWGRQLASPGTTEGECWALLAGKRAFLRVYISAVLVVGHREEGMWLGARMVWPAVYNSEEWLPPVDTRCERRLWGGKPILSLALNISIPDGNWGSCQSTAGGRVSWPLGLVSGGAGSDRIDSVRSS